MTADNKYKAERNKKIAEIYWGGGVTLLQLAKRYSISGPRVRQIILCEQKREDERLAAIKQAQR